ncbi:MAG: VWA domain-containing protein [Patescibacteria group bacterium]|jgi:Mg-chelatase subunit ChlD
MREVANGVGLKSFSRDLVSDLCNIAAGGSVNSPSFYREIVRERVEETLPAPNRFGEWIYPVRGKNGIKYFESSNDKQMIVTAHTEEAMRYHQNVCDFLQVVDLSRFPGGSPLKQAMSLLKLLSKQQGGQGGGEGGEPLPIFTDNDRPEGTAEALHETIDTVDSLSAEEQDILDPEGKNHSVEDSTQSDGQRSGHSGLNRLAVAEDLVEGSDKRVMLDISRTLDDFTKLQARRQVRMEQDPTGEEVRQRPMRSLNELSRVAKSALALRQQSSGYFLYQAVTGQIPVRERVTRMERKQAIFILVDGSGSMRGRKHWKATGVVMNRLKAVLTDDAVVWVSVFDTQLGKVQRAGTPDEARNLIREFAAGNFSGGGTDIATSVKAAHAFIQKEIESGAALYRPEVVVLTDEDSSVSGVAKPDIPGTRVHGFAMEVSNPSLVAFARSTGGVGKDKM